MPRPRRVPSVIVAGAVLLLALAAWIAAGVVQDRRRAREQEAFRARLEARGGAAGEHHALGLELAAKGEGATALAHMELAVEKDPRDLRYGNDLRLACTRFSQFDRCIGFFERLASAPGALPETRLQLALAYVDKMPDHMMGIVGQGKLSKQSIAVLTSILEKEADLESGQTRWAALYALGLNHLYWPKALRHAPASVEAFERCVRFQKEMAPEGPAPYFVLPCIGLGDALVKDGRHAEARAVWREAASAFPGDARLARRLAVEDDAGLTALVDEIRGLGITVDTDLSILWGRAP